LGAGDINDPDAEHKRSDFITLRDFRLDVSSVLGDLARCYKYWIALSDCDGFRIDTLKHVSFDQARNFCGSIKEFAANIGKQNFFLVGEIAGGDFGADRYLDVLDRNLDAALDIGEMRLSLNGVAKGLVHPAAYFDGFDAGRAVLGSHRNLGNRHVSILDDHDHVFGQKIRFSAEAASDHQVVAGVALQFFTLGIPCVYYGSEQSLGGPEASERQFLPDWKGSDRYLRETMFGASHPRGDAGNPPVAAEDANLPGFGAFGTAGSHCFDASAGAYRRIAAMAEIRRRFPVLRAGRQYARPISFLGNPFALYGPGEVVAWSRILDDEEALCVLNVHGNEPRGADVVVDAGLNPPGSSMTVVLNTAESAAIAAAHPVGSSVPVQRRADGLAFVEIRNLPPSELLVLTNHP
jgi:glycosidase